MLPSLLILALSFAPLAVGTPAGSSPPRRVYALHSGVHIKLGHPDKNYAAKRLRGELFHRGVPDRDMVVLDCPFPEATWKDIVPRDGVLMFLESMSPRSRVAQDAYRHFHQALEKRGIGPEDEVYWIGHSAGGQMGLTLAHISTNLDQFPELAKGVKPYRFHTVVTLGTPVGCNDVPESVRVRHYYSPQDRIVRIVCDGGPWVLPTWGYEKLKICPATPTPTRNCLVRCWYDVEHPDWIWRQRVLDRVAQDVAGSSPSLWSEPRAADRAGSALMQLLCHSLETENGVAIEEFPAGSGARGK